MFKAYFREEVFFYLVHFCETFIFLSDLFSQSFPFGGYGWVDDGLKKKILSGKIKMDCER